MPLPSFGSLIVACPSVNVPVAKLLVLPTSMLTDVPLSGGDRVQNSPERLCRCRKGQLVEDQTLAELDWSGALRCLTWVECINQSQYDLRGLHDTREAIRCKSSADATGRVMTFLFLLSRTFP